MNFDFLLQHDKAMAMRNSIATKLSANGMAQFVDFHCSPRREL